MATITITDAQLQAMADAIASGNAQVTMPDGSSVKYRDTEDLMKAYNWMTRLRRTQAGQTPYFVAVFK